MAVLIFAPLIRGGNRPLPLLALELAALVMFAACVMRPLGLRRLSWPMRALLGLLLAWPAMQLVPLPGTLWIALPGRDHYGAALAATGLGVDGLPATLVALRTEQSWLALLPPVAVFLTTASVSADQARRLALTFLAIAVIQGILGLAQFGTGNVGVFLLLGGGQAQNGYGTYANYDHLAGLLEMALPIALGLLAANFRRSGRRRHHSSSRRSWDQRLMRRLSRGFDFNRAALYAAATLMLLLGLIFTRSRAGILLAMIGVFLCAVMFARRVGGERSVGVATVVSVIGLALALEVGLAPVLERFSAKGMALDSRWLIYSGTLTGIGEYFPLGSGAGTFPEVFRRFQPLEVPLFVNHAHNDYLEWVFEGGIVAALLIAGFVLMYGMQWRKVWIKDHWSELRFIKVGAGIGLFLLALHGLVDFNLHIPANAIYFAFLAGVFFHPETTSVVRAPDRHRAFPEPVSDAPVEPAPRPEEQIPNPFA